MVDVGSEHPPAREQAKGSEGEQSERSRLGDSLRKAGLN